MTGKVASEIPSEEELVEHALLQRVEVLLHTLAYIVPQDEEAADVHAEPPADRAEGVTFLRRDEGSVVYELASVMTVRLPRAS